MTKSNFGAIFLIAACALSTAAWGQKVYRCGSSYSQIPCNGAVTIETQDARSKTQKTQSDQATVREDPREKLKALRAEFAQKALETAASAAKTR